MTTLQSPCTEELEAVCELPVEEALPRAVSFLNGMAEDPALFESEILPLLEGAEDAEGWYVARRHESEDGSYSLQIFVWPPGTATRVHDHSSWGVYRCVLGSIVEERYARLDDGSRFEHARLRRDWRLRWSPEDGASTVLPGDGAYTGSSIRSAMSLSRSTFTVRGQPKWTDGITIRLATTCATGSRIETTYSSNIRNGKERR